jgi:probable F420-dependent oxidoreductase
VKIRIGYGLGTAGNSDLAGLVDGLERHGFDSLWLSERVTGPAVDPLVGLSFAAGRTTKLKLGTSVLVLPGRNPVVLAKELASLDVLSGGRLLPAFGLGAPNAVEHQAFGVRREDRASIFDEMMTVMRRLWREDDVTHHGEHFQFDDVSLRLKPIGTMDVWLGGQAPSELRRVGRLSDGWLPSFCTPADAEAGRAVVEEAAGRAGRVIDPEHFGVLVSYSHTAVPERLVELIRTRRPDIDPAEIVPIGYDAVVRTLERFIDAGFSKFVLSPADPVESWDHELAATAERVLHLQRTTTAAA